MGHLKWSTERNRHVPHYWSIVISQFRKARIDVPVKNIPFEQFDHLRRGVNAHWLFQSRIKIVDEYRETGDMVHVRMGDDDVSDFGSLLVAESNCDAAGINCHAVVD